VPTQDGKGNVRGDAMSTLIGRPEFGYPRLCISRESVRTVVVHDEIPRI